MIFNVLKYVLVVALVIGVAGGISWFLFDWLIMNEPIPESAIKVLGSIAGV